MIAILENLKSINFLIIGLIIFVMSPFVFAQNDGNVSLNEIEIEAQLLSKDWNTNSIKKSIEKYTFVSKRWQETNHYSNSVSCLIKASYLNEVLGNSDETLFLIEKALDIAARYNLFEEKALLLAEKARVLIELGKKKESKDLIENALNLETSIVNAKIKASIYFCFAEYSYNQKDIEKSIEYYSKSIDFAKESNQLDTLAKSQLFLGYAQLYQSEYKESLALFQNAFSNYEVINDLRGKTLALVAIGGLNSLIGKKQAALTYYQNALKMFPDEIDLVDRARLLNGIGLVYEDYEQIDISINYREKALVLFEKANHNYGKLATLVGLGRLYRLAKNFNQSEVYFENSKELATQLNDQFMLAVIDEELGHLYFELNKISNAQEKYAKSLIYFRNNKNYREIALITEKLGEINLTNNSLEKARFDFETSMNLNKKIENNFAKAQLFFQFARLYRLENNSEEALETITESINLTETLYTDVANSNLKRSYFSNVYERYELYIHLLMQKHKESPNENLAILALQASEKSRSRSLLETLRLSEANFTKDANPQTVQKEKEIRNLLSIKTDKLTELLSDNSEKSEIDKVDDERRSLENEHETIKADLKQNSPIYSAIKNPPPFDVAEFQQNSLDDKTVLLEFAFGEKESYQWLIGKTEVSSFVLPSRSTLENRIDKIRQAFENRQILDGEDAETYQKRIADLENTSNLEANFLSNELLGQVIDKIADKRLIIVPDGKLALLPLSALPFPNSAEMLITKNEIVYQPSASLLNILPNIQTRKQLPSKDLLVFADPVFDNSDSRLTEKNESESFLPAILGLNLRDFRLMDSNGKIPRLFATQAEADSIAETVGKSRTEILSGFAASREKVLNSSIADYRILHFATHGLVDVKRPEVSSIVLSQFDENGGKREGFLRLQDIYSLDLATDLVVLSACQSGVGKEIKGEGLMSLNNAFLQAGAKSVISSAWKVDDNATAEFMNIFYSNLVGKGLTASQALRQTQIEMSKSTQFSSPFYWAAFTVQGEYRHPIKVSTNYFVYIGYGLLGLVGLWIILRFMKKRKAIRP